MHERGGGSRARHAVAIQGSLKVVASTAETERPTVGDGDVAGDARKNL
jgi:hypothetical protein